MNHPFVAQLNQHCAALNLKKEAYATLEYILNDPENYGADPDFLAGYTKEELLQQFDGFSLVTQATHEQVTIKTTIGIYIKDHQDIWLHGLIPVGHYQLHTTLEGEVLDDFFTIDKEKYVDDVAITAHFQEMNSLLPQDYLKRNHIQYNYVSYISLTGTLFLSKKFDQSAIFILRAKNELEAIGADKFDPGFLKKTTQFLHMMKDYLFRNELISEAIKSKFS